MEYRECNVDKISAPSRSTPDKSVRKDFGLYFPEIASDYPCHTVIAYYLRHIWRKLPKQ